MNLKGISKIHRILGRKTILKDGVAKVTGVEVQASDVSLPNMLHARVLKSLYTHVRVERIDALRAVFGVLAAHLTGY